MNRYRWILAGLFVVGACAVIGTRVSVTAQAEAPPAVDKTASDPAPRDAKAADKPDAGVKAITAEYAKAFNARDAKAAAALWTDDGEFTGVDGDPIRGRAAIEKSLADEFKAHPKAAIAVQVESVRVVGRHTALAEGVIKLTAPGATDVSDTHYSALHVLEDGQWRAASVREWLPDPELAASTKHLDWLVGDWTAKGEAGTLAISYAWDENKTFLNGKYSITRDGKTVSSGTQVFARDPSGGLRSWMFDSTGTFNAGTWQREGKHWIENVTGTLPDGAEIESVNVLIPLGKDAYTWQTTERTADGTPIAPLKPIKVTRTKPGASQ
jgi:uncharacterized protein (TIGR02246 family)